MHFSCAFNTFMCVIRNIICAYMYVCVRARASKVMLGLREWRSLICYLCVVKSVFTTSVFTTSVFQRVALLDMLFVCHWGHILCVCMHVCMCVCACVCMHVCMYVMYVCIWEPGAAVFTTSAFTISVFTTSVFTTSVFTTSVFTTSPNLTHAAHAQDQRHVGKGWNYQNPLGGPPLQPTQTPGASVTCVFGWAFQGLFHTGKD